MYIIRKIYIMKNIKNIVNLWKEIKLYQSERLEKENTILSCLTLIEKGVGDELENIKKRQQGISISLIEINDKLVNKIDSLGEILKGVSEESLSKGKISFELLSTCMYNKVSKEDLKVIKEVYKAYSEEIYLDIPKNQELNRVGKLLKTFFIK